MTLVTVMLAVPVLAYGTVLAQQATAFVEWVRPWLEPAAFEKLWREDLPKRYPFLMAWVRQSTGGGAMPAASTALSRVLTEAEPLRPVRWSPAWPRAWWTWASS